MKRDFFIGVRLNLQEHRALALIAAKEGTGIAETMRQLVRQEIERQGILLPLIETYLQLPAVEGVSNDVPR